MGEDERKVLVQVPWCMVCGQENDPVLVDKDAYDRWKAGEHVQVAFPDLPPEVRETMVSGTHPACFDRLFNEEEE